MPDVSLPVGVRSLAVSFEFYVHRDHPMDAPAAALSPSTAGSVRVESDATSCIVHVDLAVRPPPGCELRVTFKRHLCTAAEGKRWHIPSAATYKLS
jgi:hypothetical protein